MVSARCITLVRIALDKVGILYETLKLGEVGLKQPLSASQRKQLTQELLGSGLELMDNSKSILIEKIVNTIIDAVHYPKSRSVVNFSDHLSKKLKYDYTYLSSLFMSVTGTTIEQCVIVHKIEKIKELLLYDELNITEIAHLLHYSSASHLSQQFKKSTGLTPTFFKQLKHKRRIVLEGICEKDS